MLARKALAGTAGAPKAYVEEVFQTHLYTGNGSTQTITNNIDLSTEGGLVWVKSRAAASHFLYDTNRGVNKYLMSNATDSETTQTDSLTAFNTTGFSIGNALFNDSSVNYASWTFRQAEKFFDVVTWTGNDVDGRVIPHNLGTTPGFIVVKITNNAGDWYAWHRSLSTSYGKLNTTAAFTTSGAQYYFGDGTTTVAPTSTGFTVSASSINANNQTYVAYLFAHDAGGFGDSGSDNVITCGSFTTDGSGLATVNLGYEPQWVMVKRTDGAGSWFMHDTMRGYTADTTSGTDAYLLANTSGAEVNTTAYGGPNATGFTAYYNPSQTYIYIAIRRGPMKTPTTGTDVFYPQAISQADSPDSTNVPFPPDLINTFSRDGTNRTNNFSYFQFVDRLRGAGTPNDTRVAASEGLGLVSSGTDAEYGRTSPYTYVQLKANSRDITRGTGWNSASYGNWINYFFRRAPKFFDVVCYTATGSSLTLNHNLGVVPELMIFKRRTGATLRGWGVYSSALGTTKKLILNTNAAETTDSFFVSTTPTSTVFYPGIADESNEGTENYVAYLFASLSGVSKIGTYTGNGSSVTVTTNFQPRFILVKRTDSTGDWIVSDSARGLVAGNDPYLELNTTDAEVTNEDWVDISSTSFTVNQTTNNANVNTGTYLYLAIA